MLSKAFDGVGLRLLKDRDSRSDAERQAFLDASAWNRMLTRHEVENYLFDFEALSVLAQENGRQLERAVYDSVVPDPLLGDLKEKAQKLQHLCGEKGSVEMFKLKLAQYIKPGTPVYEELTTAILL